MFVCGRCMYVFVCDGKSPCGQPSGEVLAMLSSHLLLQINIFIIYNVNRSYRKRKP